MAAAAPESKSGTTGRALLLWLFPAAIVAAASFAGPVLNDGDTFWHLAAGRWMLAHRAVLSSDPFSYTFAGRPWTTQEWLSEVVMALAYRAAGWAGVMLLTGLAAGALAAAMSGWLLRWLSPLSALVALVLGFGLVAPSLLARPHLLALPLLAIWTCGLLDARARRAAPAPALVLLMALWANMHSSFIVGLVLAAAFGVEAALDFKAWRGRTLMGWAAFVAASLVAALATPHGLSGLAFPLRVMDMKTLGVIDEWRPADFAHPSMLEGVLLAGLFLALWRGVRLGAVRTALILGLVHASLQHARQEALLGVLAPLIAAEPFARALGDGEPAKLRRRSPLPAALGSLLVVLAIGARLAIPQRRTDGPTAPISALAHVPAALRARPVLNDYDFGGYLIFEGVRPYIDGRADMYGDAFVTNDNAIQNGDAAAAAATIARYHIAWAILRPNRRLVSVLERTPGWRRLYADKDAVVLAKDALTPSPPPSATARPSSSRG